MLVAVGGDDRDVAQPFPAVSGVGGRLAEHGQPSGMLAESTVGEFPDPGADHGHSVSEVARHQRAAVRCRLRRGSGDPGQENLIGVGSTRRSRCGSRFSRGVTAEAVADVPGQEFADAGRVPQVVIVGRIGEQFGGVVTVAFGALQGRDQRGPRLLLAGSSSQARPENSASHVSQARLHSL